MKILNKKGMTLIEIILSIGLVSIVMVQVLNILVDLKDEQLLGKDKTADLTNRSIIMKTVQDRFNTEIVTSFTNCKNDTASETVNVKNLLNSYGYSNILSCIKIGYDGNKLDYMFTTTKNGEDYFIFGRYNNTTTYVYEAWLLKSGTYPKIGCGYSVTNSCKTLETSDCFSYNYFIINYPIELSENVRKTTMNFDLEFMYYYKKSSDHPLTIDPNINNCTL